ncbi:MAG TPA: LPS export ABC transporter periplasmic protein LptC [Puia sp.]|nr:LPS export ABC transporter periplasmic protein LptC [Puia sp.]
MTRTLLLPSVVLLLLGACAGKTAVRPANPVHAVVPEEADSIVSLMSEPVDSAGKLVARVKGRLTSPFMLRFDRADSPYAEFPRSLHVDFYNDSMQVESRLDAKYGKYLQNQDKVFLRDSVVVKNILKGDTLRCKTLWWDQHTERFTTDDSVRIYTPDKILYGTGMEADQNFRWYTIMHMTGIVLHAGGDIPK